MASRSGTSEATMLAKQLASRLGLAKSGARGGSGGGTVAELARSVWRSAADLSQVGEAESVFNTLSALPPEDLARLLLHEPPEQLIRGALERRSVAVRGLAVQRAGYMLVEAWPVVAASDDEALRDACVGAFRTLFGVLNEDSSQPPEVCAAAASVLDKIMSSYLSIEPEAFAPIALLHAKWKFRPIYTTLLIELGHDLRYTAERLQDNPNLVSKTCPWLFETPSETTGPDWNSQAAEAATFRASLLWLLVSSGGLARRDEDFNRRCGSTIFDVVQEVSTGKPLHAKATRERSELPENLEDRLRRCASSSVGASDSSRFAKCRANVMLVVLELARGPPIENTAKLLLDVVEAALRDAAPSGDGSSNLSKATLFSILSCGSLLSLFPLLLPNCGVADLQRHLTLSAMVLSLGSQALPTPSAQGPDMLTPLLLLLGRAWIGSYARLLVSIGGGSVDQFFQELRGIVPPTLVAVFCRSALDSVRFSKSSATAAAAVADWLLRAGSLSEALKSTTAGGGGGGVSDVSARWTGATWLLFGLCHQICIEAPNQNISAAVANAIADCSALPTGEPWALSLLAGGLADAGALNQVPASVSEALAQACRSLATHRGTPTELSGYQEALAQVVRSGRNQQPNLSRPLCEPLSSAATSLSTALFLHRVMVPSESSSSTTTSEPITVSGPPLMVMLRFYTDSASSTGDCHLALRIDVHNVTGLSYKNVSVDVRVSRMCIPVHDSSRPTKDLTSPWPDICSTPKEATLVESLSCRSSFSAWRDLQFRSLACMNLLVHLTYENIPPDVSSPTAQGSATPHSGALGQDTWSDDEDAEHLHFSCQPLPVPLSVFFRPFYGFENLQVAATFPPPAMYLACPHTRTESVATLALPMSEISLPGFRRLLTPHASGTGGPVEVCFAASSPLAEDCLLCLLCRAEPTAKKADLRVIETVEVRSNSEQLLHCFADQLTYWMLSSR